uniref:Uncharacterized protein n=1 Tax=Podarcis muralis TaxID=64176 RepID=A0A670JCI9_PODMU
GSSDWPCGKWFSRKKKGMLLKTSLVQIVKRLSLILTLPSLFSLAGGDPQLPDNFNMWLMVGASLGALTLAVLIGGIIIYARCRRREKFTTPIEETGGHSAQESLIH